MKNNWQILDVVSLVSQCTSSHSTSVEVFTQNYLHTAFQNAPVGQIIAVLDGKQSCQTSEAIFEFLYNLGVNGVKLAGEKSQDVIAYLTEKLPGQITVHTANENLISLTSQKVRVLLEIGIEPQYVTLYKSLLALPNFTDNTWKTLVQSQVFSLEKLIVIAENFQNLFSTQLSPNMLGRAELAELVELAKTDNVLALIAGTKASWGAWTTFYQQRKCHPEIVESSVKGNHFNRLQWFKRVPSRQGILTTLDKIGAGGYLGEFERYLPAQSLITKQNFNLSQLLQKIENSRFIALDWETWAERNENFDKAGRGEYVDMFGSKITGVGITCGQNLEHTFYLQFAHADVENNIDKRHLLELLEAIPEHLPLIIQNMMFEIVVLKSEFGVELSNPIFDTKIMHSHVDEMSSSGLKDLSKRYLNYDQIKYADVVTKGTTMKDYTGAEIFQYGADDPLVTAHLFDLFYIILNVEGTWDFVQQHEFPTVNLLADSHVKGVSIDLEKCSQYKAHDARLQAACIQNMRDLIQENQNIDELPHHANKWFEAEIKPTLDFQMKKVFKLNTVHNLRTIPELEFIDADLLNDVVDRADMLDLYQDERKTYELKIKRNLVAKSYLYDENKELNLNSPKQMQELFYGMLGMPIRIRNPKVSDARQKKGLFNGEPQVNEVAIQEALVQQDATGWKAQVLENLLKAKKAATRISLFYEKFPLWQHPTKDGLIHPQFNSTGTESRRPSGSSPNFLQLSKKDDGLDVRRCILPNSKMGHDLICSIDWDGEELRAIAGLSGDKELTACYVGENLKDVHSIVAAQIQGCSYEEFVAIRKGSQGEKQAKKYDNLRKMAKSVTFLSNYGGGSKQLARQLHIPESQAATFLQAKKEAYSGMERWKNSVVQDLRRKGYVKTLYGSRKHVYDKLFDSELSGYYERSSVNFLVQGVCADYLKVVLSNLWKNRTFQRHNAVLIALIYDELVFSCHHTQAVSLIQDVYAEMTKGIPGLNIPMLANPALGINFADQVEILKDCNQALTDELILQTILKVLPITQRKI